MHLLFAILLGAILHMHIFVKAECEKCGTISSAACFSETTFKFCFPDGKYSELKTCPSGLTCTDTANICTAVGPPFCQSNCGKCHPEKKYACVSETEFALCYDTGSPTLPVQKCPTINPYCKYDMTTGGFCVKDRAASPTCSQDEIYEFPTTTPPPINTPDAFCEKSGKSGRFPVNGDKTCKLYIYCYMYGRNLIGQQYACPGTTLFNPTLQICVQSTQYTCTVK